MNLKRDAHAEAILRPIRWLTIASALVAAAAILGLLNGSARAEDDGFESGSKTFTNPFASPPAGNRGGSNFFDDEDFEDEIPQFTNDQQRSAQGSTGAPAGNTAASRGAKTGPAAQGAPGISMGGTSPGGVVHSAGAPQVPAIKIDDETGLGQGGKEAVTDFNFPDADIMDIAKTLGKLTGKNFILDKDVKGRVTIISNSPITVADAWKAFLTALDMTGFALIPSGNYIRIARQRDARDKQLKTFTGDYSPDSDALITRVFPLKYIDAENVTRVLRSFMP